jgi:hypothetical protein
MISIRVILPKKALFDMPKLEKSLNTALDSAAEQVKTDFKRTTGTWNHKPAFRIDKHPWVRMVYTSDVIYSYVSKGTRPHPIRPRNAKALHFFRTGFRAKSRVNSLTSNKGAKATKDETFSKGVMHPGTAARNFDETIAKRWRPLFPKQIQRAIQNAFG